MLKQKLSLVPLKPGCYLMKNKDNYIIYVGKAKNLKNRLNSYFTGTHSGKTLMMIKDVNDFEYIVTSTEIEALILEMNLIKKYTPKYNILLKDDKSYPYIELTNEKYPKLTIVRNTNLKKYKNSLLFGPYPNVYAARKTVDLLNRMYPLRKCNVVGKEECLYYHLDQCLGYCIKDIETKDIINMKKEIIKFLKGDHSIISSKLETEMLEASKKLQYEKANEYKELLAYINITLKDQIVNLNTNDNLDVFGYFYDKGYLSMQVFFIRDGKLLGRDSSIFEVVDTIEEEVLEYIVKFYSKNNIKPKEIMVSKEIDNNLLENYLNIKVKVPERGKYKKVLSLAISNASINLKEKWEIIKTNEDSITEALQELCNKLGIEKASRIEIFDNSNLFGTFYVSGMVVFIDGKPNKREYRKYKISDPNIKDDISAMKEVIYRRYFRVLKDKLEQPDLIIVDGGINQIKIAQDVINGFKLNIPVAGLKKDDKHNTSELLGKEPIETIEIDKRSKLFKLLSIMQDEVHRFSITFHKQIRSKSAFSSILDLVPGI
ncbi:MAG: excinuclease ABC subunit UvrC, partial [Bacilli bacterium]|nr:excinuclease ABC subunit UvrC [Bacilli bacterium]